MVDHYCFDAIARAKYRSRQKKVAFELTVADFRRLMIEQKFKCAISGIEFSLQPVTSSSLRAFRPSIDRIEPVGGYKVGNVRLVCEIVNLAMNQWGEQPLLKLVEAMATRLGEPRG